MSKKIVVITGSPRKKGNSFAMTEAFIQAAEAKGHTVTRFDAAMKNVGGCRACETCFRTGKACSFDDDFNTIAPAILEADAVVFSMPVYWYSIPAQIKGVITACFLSWRAAGISAVRSALSSHAVKKMICLFLTVCVSRWNVLPH